MAHIQRVLITIACGFVGVALPPAAWAQRPMTLVDLINVPALNDPQLSPDGSQVLYVVSNADWKANKRVSHIWRVQIDGTRAVQMTSGAKGETSPRWAPDGRTIAFLADREEGEGNQIFLLPSDGGEARPLTSHPTAASNISWAPDGKAIYFVAADPKSAEEKARQEAKDDVYAFDENYQQNHLWKIDLQSKEETRVTSGDFSILSYNVSNDGKRIAHHRAPNPLFGYAEQGEVWVMAADGGGALQLTKNSVPEGGATLSPDGSQVLFLAGANEKFEIYYNDDLFIVPSTGGTPRDLATNVPHEIENAEWSKDGSSIFFTANMGVHNELFEMSASGGTPKQLTNGQHSLRGWSYVSTAGRHVFAIDLPTSPGEVWTMTTGAPAQVTHVFDAVARDYKLPRQEKATWKGADGATVEGVLYYPVDYTPGQRYPLVVQTHGGPQASDKFGFPSGSSYVAVLTAKGYAVLKPNYRGSTGYGDAFLRDMVGSYFKNAHLDVMTGVDHLIAQGLVDQERMAKMGWSGGGHMTNKVITFTNRFKAASSGAGAANWVSMYAQSDVRTYRTPWFGGTPWQKNAPIDTYWEHSPLKYISNVTTPTIFLVGEEDVRVPMPQSVEMYRALKSNGIPTHLYVAPREPHGWNELRHQLFKMNVELDWFEKHVMNRTYTWEKAPDDTPRRDRQPTTAQEPLPDQQR